MFYNVNFIIKIVSFLLVEIITQQLMKSYLNPIYFIVLLNQYTRRIDKNNIIQFHLLYSSYFELYEFIQVRNV